MTRNFMKRPLAVADDDETFPNAWLIKENDHLVDMADHLVPFPTLIANYGT